jgi:hypothetical protein
MKGDYNQMSGIMCAETMDATSPRPSPPEAERGKYRATSEYPLLFVANSRAIKREACHEANKGNEDKEFTICDIRFTRPF